MNAIPSQAESRPTTPHQPNQAEGANGTGVELQQQQRNPVDNTNHFIEVLQLVQHSLQQMMKEICQLNAYKAKEKGSQHDPEHETDKEVKLVGSGLQNMEKCFFTMVNVVALLK